MLIDSLKDASLAARKSRDPLAGVYSTLFAEASRPGKDKGNRPSTDEEVVKVLNGFLNSAKANLESCQKLGRVDQIEQIRKEIDIYESFLPKMLSDAELKAAVHAAAESVGAADMRAMKDIKEKLLSEHGASVDMSKVAVVYKEYLASK